MRHATAAWAGARIGLALSSSNVSRVDRTLSVGHAPGKDAEMQPAVQTIFHDSERLWRVALSIGTR